MVRSVFLQSVVRPEGRVDEAFPVGEPGAHGFDAASRKRPSANFQRAPGVVPGKGRLQIAKGPLVRRKRSAILEEGRESVVRSLAIWPRWTEREDEVAIQPRLETPS